MSAAFDAIMNDPTFDLQAHIGRPTGKQAMVEQDCAAVADKLAELGVDVDDRATAVVVFGVLELLRTVHSNALGAGLGDGLADSMLPQTVIRVYELLWIRHNKRDRR